MSDDWLTPPPQQLPGPPGVRPPTHPSLAVQPQPLPQQPQSDAASTLVEMQRTLMMLTQAQQAAVVNHIQQTPTMGQAFIAWLKKNIIWMLGILGGAFMLYQELRDEYRDGQRDTKEFRDKTDKSIDDSKLDMRLHKYDEGKEREKFRKAINEVQVGTMQGIEQVQKEIRIVHPSLERRAPKESLLLQKAKIKAKTIESDAKLFDDVTLPEPPE